MVELFKGILVTVIKRNYSDHKPIQLEFFEVHWQFN